MKVLEDIFGDNLTDNLQNELSHYGTLGSTTFKCLVVENIRRKEISLLIYQKHSSGFVDTITLYGQDGFIVNSEYFEYLISEDDWNVFIEHIKQWCDYYVLSQSKSNNNYICTTDGDFFNFNDDVQQYWLSSCIVATSVK
ncbi:MAG: hypothetical protein ACE5RC_09215 [Nitrosopumilus sp.]